MNIQKTAPTPKLVTMIPADPQMTERDLRKKHLRVAPYCRVSTDKKEQLSSYEAQIEYYTEKINANPDWTLVRLYADEGITGTSAKKRKDFLQMIRDCERGKIDLVITKSVSRFCRNTLDGLNYVRRLKRHGVGVYFEKENVNTLFMDNEMILTFMMSQAQAESESLSGNVRWGHRKNFKDGKVYYHCALPGFVDSKNEEKTERNAGYLVVSHSGGGMLRQGTRKGIRRTPANRGMRAHWVVKGLDISEDVCHGLCP